MATERIAGFCALCRSRCGCISVVEDGRLVAVEPDPGHPTGESYPERAQDRPRARKPEKRTDGVEGGLVMFAAAGALLRLIGVPRRARRIARGDRG